MHAPLTVLLPLKASHPVTAAETDRGTVGGNIKTSKYLLCVCGSLGKRMLPFIPTNTTSDSFRSRDVLARDSYHLTLFLKCDPRKPLEVSNACNFVTLLNISILRKKL